MLAFCGMFVCFRYIPPPLLKLKVLMNIKLYPLFHWDLTVTSKVYF